MTGIWLPIGLGLAALAQTSASTPPILTMDEAVAIADQNAFAIRTALSSAEQAEANARAAGSSLGPRFNATGSYLQFDENGPSSLSSAGSGLSGGTTRQTTDGSAQTGGGSIPRSAAGVQFQVSQLIDFLGVVRKSIDAAWLAAEAQDALVEAERNASRGQVRQAYLGVLQAKALVVVQEQQVAAAEARLENITLIVDAGERPRFNQLQLETELASNRQALLESENNLALAKQALNNLLGRPIDTPFDVADPNGPMAVDASSAELIALAQANRNEVKAALLAIEAQTKIRQGEEGGLLPTLSVSATHTRTIDPPAGSPEHSTYGAVILSWPLFDSGNTRARVAAARESEEQATIRAEQIQLGVSLEVSQALTNLANAQAVLTVAESAQTTAAESLRLAELRFQEADGILLDVITAQAEYTRASQSVVQARYAMLSAYAALQQAIGLDDFANHSMEEPS